MYGDGSGTVSYLGMPIATNNSLPSDQVWMINNPPHYGKSVAEAVADVQRRMDKSLNEMVYRGMTTTTKR